MIAHRQSVIKEHGIESHKQHTPPCDNSSEQARRKAPPPPGTEVDSLDLAGVERRQKIQSHSGGRPKSDIDSIRPAPSPPKRHDSLGTKIQPKNKTKNPPKIVKPSDNNNDDNQSESSDGSVGGVAGVGGISPNTTRRINSYLNRAGTDKENGLESVEESKIELPTEFPTELGVELIDVVRERLIVINN